MDLLLPGLLVVLLVFMFWSSRRRNQKAKAEQAEKARLTVPGAKVLLQGGLYGTIVDYDPDDLDKPAVVEIAPGVDIEVHSQAILRVVNPAEGLQTEDDFDEVEADEDADVADEVESGEAETDRTEVADEPTAEQTSSEPDADAQPKA